MGELLGPVQKVLSVDVLCTTVSIRFELTQFKSDSVHGKQEAHGKNRQSRLNNSKELQDCPVQLSDKVRWC